MTGERSGSEFREGDNCLVIDNKGRRYLLHLSAQASFSTHRGVIAHSAIIGAIEGSTFATEAGGKFVMLRPRLTDYILKMKRGAQVVYPKDIGPILVFADIRPGACVLEAGTGSGALTMALVQAVGPAGRVISIERREDHARHARAGIERWFGEIPDTLDLRIGDVEEHVAGVSPDRIVLDLPEPWHTAELAVQHLTPGGVFCAYVPTVPQMQQTVEALRSSRRFLDITIFETTFRTWNVEGRSVRPDHRMVGHTGFVIVARKVESYGPDLPDNAAPGSPATIEG